uniref:Uncharacterized protein n=1 Tax=Tanacetum cinerariifolium TaxID=118510 RepID=A0A699TT31_TANCI|nr:hypothetical protein [Tanacetum cinerariifolium]
MPGPGSLALVKSGGALETRCYRRIPHLSGRYPIPLMLRAKLRLREQALALEKSPGTNAAWARPTAG